MAKKPKFYPEEIKRLDKAWQEMMERRSQGTGVLGATIMFWSISYGIVGLRLNLKVVHRWRIMSNMSLPTEKLQTLIKFKRGDIVNARGQIGVIVDVLQSAETDNICLYIRFVHNLGNARPYDMLEITSERMLGVDKWTLATQEDLDQAIAKRKVRLDKEVEELLNITTGQNSR